MKGTLQSRRMRTSVRQFEFKAYRRRSLRNNIRRELILDRADAVAQDQFAFLQPLRLDQIDAGRSDERGDGGVEVAMLLLQAGEFLPQRAFVLVVHRHRCPEGLGPRSARRLELQVSRFPQQPSSVAKTSVRQRLPVPPTVVKLPLSRSPRRRSWGTLWAFGSSTACGGMLDVAAIAPRGTRKE